MRLRRNLKRLRALMHYRSLAFRLALVSIAVLMIVVSVLFYQNQYAIHLMHEQTTQVIATDLNTQIEKIEAHLDNIDAYIFNLGLLNEDIRSLGLIRKETVYNLTKRRIFDEIADDLKLYSPVSAFFIYVPSREDAFSVSTQREPYSWRSKVEDRLRDEIINQQEQGSTATDVWMEDSLGGIGYVYNIRHLYGVSIGAYINLSTLFEAFKPEPKYDSEVQILLDNYDRMLYQYGNFMGNEELMEDLALYERGTSSYLGKNKKFLYVAAPLRRLSADLYAVVADREVLNQFYYIRKLLPVLGAAFALLIPLLVFMNYYLVVRPVKRMIQVMNKVRDGDLQKRMNIQETSMEFLMLNKNFNNMMDEIETLKIEAYEQKLEYSRMELEMLELQLNPHFFANTLNVIYRLAQNNNDKTLENISMSLIRFFRYAINGRSALVPFYSEIGHVEDYLQIQKYRYGDRLDVRICISEESRKVEYVVPRLCIQGLLENSIKHGYIFGQTLQIVIETMIEENGKLLIRISDNGPGFKPEILNALEYDYNMLEKDGHIGLTNLFRRIKIIYDEAADIRCFNKGGDGHAVVELRFPAQCGDEGLINECTNR